MSLLILGATSQIARQTARVYASHGHSVVLAAQDTDEAASIAADLRVRYGVDAHALAFEATDFDAHEILVEEAESLVGPLDFCLLAFGVMVDPDVPRTDARAARRVIDVNYAATVSLGEAIAARMEARGRGTIVGIGSVAGDRGRQSNYLYGSTKAAVDRFLQGLRNRLYPAGVHVLTVKPGFVDTRMTWGMDTGRIPRADPAAVAEAIHRAADKRVDTLYVPGFWKGVMFAIRHIPEGVFKRMKL